MRRDWDAGMPYLWQAFGLAEAVEESGDLYAASEIHRHLGFYYLYEDARPREAVRQLGRSLAAPAACCPGGSATPRQLSPRPRQPPARRADAAATSLRCSGA